MIDSTMGYSPKDLQFGDEGRKKLISGISKIAGAVKSTLGPRGNTVLIESPNHTGSITVTKDGVTVAKAVDLMDPVENLAVKMMKEAADKTANSAGDGTTTAIVLTEAIVKIGDQLMDDDTNRTLVLREVVEIGNKVVEKLQQRHVKVSEQTLLDVATISANNDKAIGETIAKVYNEIGENGIVTVEKSQTTETYAESTHGFKIQRGYYSPMFINDHKKDECIYEDVMVLISDAEIHNLLQIEPVLKPIIQEGKKLLLIAPCSVNVINTLAASHHHLVIRSTS
jgi:chaperonin GroEL